MNRPLYFAAFFVGLAAVCWLGVGYIGSNPLALAMTVLIGAFYLMGALELHRFQQATTTLSRSLTDLRGTPEALGPWLARLHPSLQNAVRLRVEGERTGLPGPAMTPYLAGLLVLLGMLGTFLGMVITLHGTSAALESATDVQSIRSSLAAPVKGLGLAFGTSVAGVAASAMLGLMSALCRRQRLHAAQALDGQLGTSLRAFSPAHQREESFKLLQQQTQLMPQLVDRLQAMMEQMERQGQELNARLVAGQESFHSNAEAAYSRLAVSVDQSLKQSLTESARLAGAAIQPVTEATMAGIARETASLQQTLSDSVQRQLEGLSTRFEASTAGVAELWKAALAQHQRAGDQLLEHLRQTLDQHADAVEQRSASLLLSVEQSHAALRSEIASQDRQRLAEWTQALESNAAALQREWQQAGAQTLAQQQQICATLEQTAHHVAEQAQSHAQSTISEVAQLVQAAAEAPRAAAEVIAELRQKLSDSMARDNAVLEERSKIMETLAALLDALNHASAEQRGAIDALVASSATLLQDAGQRFAEKADAESAKLADVSAQITGSTVEVASLGEAFGLAVQLFSQSNEKLMSQLQRIEGALSKSIVRSDEQLAYYVAQAREIIDLSLMSQKQIVEDLQQLSARRAAAGADA